MQSTMSPEGRGHPSIGDGVADFSFRLLFTLHDFQTGVLACYVVQLRGS